MEAVGGFHDLRNHTGTERHRRIGERRPENRLGSKTKFATLAGAAGILGIQPGQGREFLPCHYPLAERQEFFLDGHVRGLPVGIDANLAQAVFDGDNRKVLDVGGIQILLHVVRGKFRDIGRDLSLLLLCKTLVLKRFPPLLTQPVQGLPKILLNLRVAAEGCPDLVDPLRHLTFHHILVHGQGIQPGLHQEQL